MGSGKRGRRVEYAYIPKNESKKEDTYYQQKSYVQNIDQIENRDKEVLDIALNKIDKS